jgi:hypothetical protein
MKRGAVALVAVLAAAVVLSIAVTIGDDDPPPPPADQTGPTTTGGGAGADGPTPTCTRIVGYSQTRQWYLASFESVVPDERFELFWMGGAAIRAWAGAAAWDSGTLESACATGPPTRLVIDVGVGGENLGDVEAYASFIRDAVAMARARFPGVQIGLQPLVGGPRYAPCTIVHRGALEPVNASVAAPAVAQAIDLVVEEDPAIFRGPNPMLASCDMYRDALGHLTTSTRDDSTSGDVHAGGVIGAFYAGAES